jgi:hypothetical protein
MGSTYKKYSILRYTCRSLKDLRKDITDAQIKKHIIEESIYGVDIDAGAVDIATTSILA